MALVVCLAIFANAAVGEGLSATASAPPELLADGFLFGISLGALTQLFAPPTPGEGS